MLKKFRILCEKKKIPIISTQTEKILTNLLNYYKPKYILEIWSGVWYSWIFIEKIVNKRWGKILSFELSPQSYEECVKNRFKFKAWNIKFYNFDFLKINLKKLLYEPFDFVFIDAMKRHYLNYFFKANQYCKNNCIFLFDDVIKYKHKIQNLYKFLEKNQINYKIFKSEDGDWVLIIKKDKFSSF